MTDPEALAEPRSSELESSVAPDGRCEECGQPYVVKLLDVHGTILKVYTCPERKEP